MADLNTTGAAPPSSPAPSTSSNAGGQAQSRIVPAPRGTVILVARDGKPLRVRISKLVTLYGVDGFGIHRNHGNLRMLGFAWAVSQIATSRTIGEGRTEEDAIRMAESLIAESARKTNKTPEVVLRETLSKVKGLPATLALDVIRRDGGTQPRAVIDREIVADYAQAMKTGAKFPPLVVFFDGVEYWLADGFHRGEACAEAGIREVECDVYQGTLETARWYSFSANRTHGLRRTNVDKQRAVRAALAHPKAAGLSDRQIAEHCGVGHNMVSEYRKTMEPTVIGGQSSHRTGLDGRTINTANIGKTATQPTGASPTVAAVVQPLGRHMAEPATIMAPPHVLKPAPEEPGTMAVPEKPLNAAEPTASPASPVFNIVQPAKRVITLDEWKILTSSERQAALRVLNPKAGLNRQDSDSIEWARRTWNPVTGCLHKCTYCYARDGAERFYPQKFVPSIVPDVLSAPLNASPPAEAATDVGYKNVFVCSMADLFGNWVPREWIEAVLGIARQATQWNFLVLTKFPQRLVEFEFPENVWVGTTVDLQARVAHAERAMRQVKAKVKWLSLEPLIEHIEIDFSIFQWVVIGGASKSSQTPEWRPPRRWVTAITHEAEKAGCAVYHKTNLKPPERLRNYPGFEEKEAVSAPSPFHYLKETSDDGQ